MSDTSDNELRSALLPDSSSGGASPITTFMCSPFLSKGDTSEMHEYRCVLRMSTPFLLPGGLYSQLIGNEPVEADSLWAGRQDLPMTR
jgi:hypothetical protein